MSARIVSKTEEQVKIEVVISRSDCMLTGEELIQETLNQAGVLATGFLLEHFDADGSPLLFGSEKLTSKGLFNKSYQTPYGTAQVKRHLYQSSSGGRTHCPLEVNARIVVTSTPKFAQQLASKYSLLGAPQVVEDLCMNHNRNVTKALVQDTVSEVAVIAQKKEACWTYVPPAIDSDDVTAISVGLDGAHMLMCDEGWREAMVGTIALYNSKGTRLHTQYLSSPPEYGKAKFFEKLRQEIEQTKRSYPDILTIGLADGAKCNWEFLEEHTDWQTIDFYHVSQYVASAADAIFPKASELHSKEEWYESKLDELRTLVNGARSILKELEAIEPTVKNKSCREKLKSTISYFKNNHSRMHYAKNLELDLPIGSGVTEAGAKVIIKQRMCGSGMRWKTEGARAVMDLRCLIKTKGRWKQFWDKVMRYGIPARTR